MASANPFMINMGAGHSKGLQGLAASLDNLSVQREKKAKEAKFVKMKAEAQEVFATHDPGKIADFMLENPEMAKAMEISAEFYNKESEKSFLKNAYSILTDAEEGNVTASISERRNLLASLGNPTKETEDLNEFEKEYLEDPEAATRKLEMEVAAINPDLWKNWRTIYRPELSEKAGAKSEVGKWIDEYNKLIASGMGKDHPHALGLQNRITQKAPEKAVKLTPSAIRKWQLERDELVEQFGFEKDHPDVVALQDAIDGKRGIRPEPTTLLAKYIKERKKLLAEGADPNGKIMKAYNDKIAGKDSSIEAMSPKEIAFWGARYNLTGTIPSIGRGKEAFGIRHAIIKSAAAQKLGNSEFALRPNMTPLQAALASVGDKADTKALSGSLSKVINQDSMMGSFVQNLGAQIDEVKAMADDIKKTDIKLLNMPIRYVVGKIKGSALQTKYEMYLLEIANEVGKLSSGNVSSIAELSTHAQKRWDQIHDPNLSIKHMLELLDETQNAANLRQTSIRDQEKKLRKRLRDRDWGRTDIDDFGKPIAPDVPSPIGEPPSVEALAPGQGGGPGMPPPALPQVITDEDYSNLKSGDKYIDENGNSATKR